MGTLGDTKGSAPVVPSKKNWGSLGGTPKWPPWWNYHIMDVILHCLRCVCQRGGGRSFDCSRIPLRVNSGVFSFPKWSRVVKIPQGDLGSLWLYLKGTPKPCGKDLGLLDVPLCWYPRIPPQADLGSSEKKPNGSFSSQFSSFLFFEDISL